MHILIVDDSKVSRMMIKGIVEAEQPAATISEADNGHSALDIIEQQTPDICFIDFNMPGMDGLELASQIKAKSTSSKLHLLTANIQESIQKRASDMGVNFISKPITADKIKSAL